MSDQSVLILGIGNLLWADEGFGVRAVEELHRRYQFPENVKLMDGGTPAASAGSAPSAEAARRHSLCAASPLPPAAPPRALAASSSRSS